MASGANFLHHASTAVPYIATGHIRTALRHPDGVVVAFHDGTITAGQWTNVQCAYPSPMHTVWNRPLLEAMIAAADDVRAVQQSMLSHLEYSPDYQPR